MRTTVCLPLQGGDIGGDIDGDIGRDIGEDMSGDVVVIQYTNYNVLTTLLWRNWWGY